MKGKIKGILLTAALMGSLIIPMNINNTKVKALSTPYVGVLEYGFSYTIKATPSTNGSAVCKIQFGQSVAFVGEVKNSAGNTWNKVQLTRNGKTVEGYVYNDKVGGSTRFSTYKYDSAFEKKIASFPDSYKLGLRYMHTVYPKWNFTPLNTGLDFSTAAANYQKKALIDSDKSSLIASSTVLEGKSWRRANLATVKYLLDPRNYLNAYDGVVFNKLTYNTSETEEDAETVLKNSVLKKYASTFVDACQDYDVSLFNAVTRALVEQGNNGGLGYKGGKGSDGKTYYNIFNIGANTGAEDGIEYAEDQGWDTISKSIYGGVRKLGSTYLSVGQWSLYLQRFNVNPSAKYGTYSHSYMTNIRAPMTEGKKLSQAYCNSENHLDEKTKHLYIPVYKNMPNYTTYPDTTDTYLTNSHVSLPNSSTSTTTKLTVSSVSRNLYEYDGVVVSWNKVSGAKSYKVQYKKKGWSSYKDLGTTTSTSLKASNLEDNAGYIFRVQVAGSSTYKENTSYLYTMKKVDTPKLSKSSSKVKVTWKDVYGNSGYEISKSTSATGTSIVATGTKNATSKTISATKKKAYYYKVRAYKTVDGKKVYAPWSSAVKYTLK